GTLGSAAHVMCMQASVKWESASPRREGIGIEPVGPHRIGFLVFVERKHLRLRALLAEFMRGIDREQHRLALALVRAELLAFEGNEPEVLPAHHQIAPARS